MLREAVLGMLPKNKLRALRAKKLRIYLDDKGLQRHTGQKPQLARLSSEPELRSAHKFFGIWS